MRLCLRTVFIKHARRYTRGMPHCWQRRLQWLPISTVGKTRILWNFSNFESRLAAAVAKIKSHGSGTLRESIALFVLLSKSNIDANQRISILSAAGSHSNNSESAIKNEELMNSTKYDPMVSIRRRCDASAISSCTALLANSTTFPRHGHHLNHRTPQLIAELKQVSPCKTCSQWGDWHCTVCYPLPKKLENPGLTVLLSKISKKIIHV